MFEFGEKKCLFEEGEEGGMLVFFEVVMGWKE